MMGVIITKRFATLYELQTIYSYEDALDLYEVAAVNATNERKAVKAGEKKHGRRHY